MTSRECGPSAAGKRAVVGKCVPNIRPRVDDCIKPKLVVCLNQTGKVVRSQIQSLEAGCMLLFK